MKEELLYGRYDTKQMTIEELKTLIWRLEIFHHLLESEDLFSQWWSASNDQEEKIL